MNAKTLEVTVLNNPGYTDTKPAYFTRMPLSALGCM